MAWWKICTVLLRNSSNLLVKRSACSQVPHGKTVYALSSGHGVCGVAVIRVSGPKSCQVLHRIAGFSRLPEPRTVHVKRMHHPQSGALLDRGLAVWFPGPHSFTGEDCCELHVHGGPAVLSAMLEALSSLPGLSPAEPGDFTKRAFQNGKLDLTEAEGLADLLHAETEVQRQQALRQMQGALKVLYVGWKEQLLQCTAHAEAYIDFSEEDNIEDNVMGKVAEVVSRLQGEISHHLADHRRGERLRSGVHVAIIGEPNVGKSSLLNAICRHPAAIVSPMAGTTRDVVEKPLNIGGYPVLLSDTAGLRSGSDLVEQEGVRRAISRARAADLTIVMLDAQTLDSNVPQGCTVSVSSLLAPLMEHFKADDISAQDTELLSDSVEPAPRIVLLNKCDLVENSGDVLTRINSEQTNLMCCAISCMTEEGMEEFLAQLTCNIKDLCADPVGPSPSLTQARHRHHLTQCLQALQTSTEHHGTDVVLEAHHLRQALRELGKLTGQVTSEEILDVIFRDFCIGK